MAATPPRVVDQTGLKTGQAITILLLALAFIFDSAALVAFVAFAQIMGAFDSPYAPYRLFYTRLIKPSGVLKPNPIPDNPEPHRFALLVGALFNGAAVLAISLGAPVVGWVLVGIVFVLANLNFWLGFCAGCWMYYLFNRIGVPGFTVSRLTEGTHG